MSVTVKIAEILKAKAAHENRPHRFASRSAHESNNDICKAAFEKKASELTKS